ncbi:MAG: xylulokinase [Candidatus Caldatribacteriaceae bacterium]
MKKRYLLGVDLGTSSMKGTLLDLGGDEITTASVELQVSYPDSYSAEQNPEEWWKAFLSLLRKLGEKVGNLEGIEGIGLSGQMLGLLVLDEHGRPLRPAIIWCDQRSFRELEYIQETLGVEKLLEYTANTPLTGYWLPKILWLRNHEPAVLERAKKFLLPKDYLRFRLTGNYVTEVSDASGTLVFDVPRRKWSEEIIEFFALDRNAFPEVVESPEVTGYVSEDVARETGLRPQIPVVGGGGDQSSGGVGLGVVKSGIISCVLGTSGVVMSMTESPKRDHKNRGLHSFCYSIPGTWFLMGCTLAAGGSYQWFFRSLQQLKGDLRYEDLNELAAGVPAGSEGILFLPYLIGERTPHSDPKARGVFWGLSYHHGLGHMVRSVIEGVAFSQRESVEILSEFGLTGERVVLSGGAARSSLWCRIFADVIGLPMVTTSIEDPASLGAAIIAGVGTAHFGSFEEGCSRYIKERALFEPSRENHELYSDLFAQYRRLYQELRDFNHSFPLFR